MLGSFAHRESILTNPIVFACFENIYLEVNILHLL